MNHHWTPIKSNNITMNHQTILILPWKSHNSPGISPHALPRAECLRMSTGETALALAKDEETKVRVGTTWWEVIFMANSWEFYGDFMVILWWFWKLYCIFLRIFMGIHGIIPVAKHWFLHMDLRGRFQANIDNWSIRPLVVLFSSPKDETRRNFTTSWHIVT